MESDPMEVDRLLVRVYTSAPGIPVLHLVGDLNLNTGAQFRRAIEGLMDQGYRQIVIDLSLVSYLDSSGLGVLVWALRRQKESNGNLGVVSPDPAMRRILDITRLNQALGVYSTAEEALDALVQPVESPSHDQPPL